MLKTRAIRDKWRNGASTSNMWMVSSALLPVENLGRLGFDTMTIDLQHGVIDETTAAALILAVEAAGSVPLVRLQSAEAGHVGRMLDYGAQGLICPMINTAADAEQLVRNCRYAPLGERSFGPIRAGLDGLDSYFNAANTDLLIFPMIETREALENIADILAVDGISGAYLGPFDLSISLGLGLPLPRPSSTLVEAIARAKAACDAAGAWAGIHAVPGMPPRHWAEEGFNLVTLGMDVELLRSAAMKALADFNSVSGKEH